MGARTIRRTCTLAFAAVGLIAATAYGAQAGHARPSISGPVTGVHAALPAPAAPDVILYDQTANAGLNGISSQNFESAYDTFDNQGADDFVVPGGQAWSVDHVDALGIYFNGAGPMASANVWFYADAGGLPGAQVYEALAVVPTSDSAGSIALDLPTPAVLPPGTYWVSVQANLDFAVGGQWGWTENTVQTNSESAWQNPLDGFVTGCTTWSARVSTCGVGGPDPDLSFALSGSTYPSATVCSTPGVAIPDNDTTGVTDTMTVSGTTGTILDLDTSLQVTHTWVGDVTVMLTHDDTATSAVYFDRPGLAFTPTGGCCGCSGDNVDVTANDQGSDTAIEDQCANLPAVSGNAIGGDPANPANSLLSAFNGEDLAGSWSAFAWDGASGDTGTLDQWCLTAVIDAMPFLDGFESGDTSHWSQVSP